MYSMKEACTLTNMTYENLKFYCNEGLVPNVKRDRRNYRVFDEHDIKWIQSLNCLKSCGMSIAEMKQYLALCMEGEGTIPEQDYCNTLSCLTAHRHRISASSQCMPQPFAVP